VVARNIYAFEVRQDSTTSLYHVTLGTRSWYRGREHTFSISRALYLNDFMR